MMVVMRASWPPRLHLHRPRAAAVVLSLGLLLFASSAQAVPSTPFASLVQSLMERFFAVTVACPAAEPDWHTCFRVQPASVVMLAEEVEKLVESSEKGILRSDWLYGNGVHQVYLHVDDTAWGYLELWLVELPGNRVDGRIAHVPRRRW